MPSPSGTPTNLSPPPSLSHSVDGQLQKTSTHDIIPPHHVVLMADAAAESTPWLHLPHLVVPALIAPLVTEQSLEESLDGSTRKCHACTLCQRSFRRPYLLKDHMISRHGSATPGCSYRCDYPGCDSVYSSRSNLRRHSQRKHPPVSTTDIASKAKQSTSEVAASASGMESDLDKTSGLADMDELLASVSESWIGPPKFAAVPKRARGVLAAHRGREAPSSARDVPENRSTSGTTETDPQANIAKQHEVTQSVGSTQDGPTSPVGPSERLASEVTPTTASRGRTASPVETDPAVERTSDLSDEEMTNACDMDTNTEGTIPDGPVSDPNSRPVASASVPSSAGHPISIPDKSAKTIAEAAREHVPTSPLTKSLSYVPASPTHRPQSPRNASPPCVNLSRILYGDLHSRGLGCDFDPTRMFSSTHLPRGDGGSIWSGQGPGLESLCLQRQGTNMSPRDVSELSKRFLGDSLFTISHTHADFSISEPLEFLSGFLPLQHLNERDQQVYCQGFLAGFSHARLKSPGLAGAQATSSSFRARPTEKDNTRADEGPDSLRPSELPIPPTSDATRPIITAETTRISAPPPLLPEHAPRPQSLIEADDSQPTRSTSRPGEKGAQPHICTLCGHTYRRPYQLRDHMQFRHSDGVKGYTCDFEGCDRTFTTRSNAKKHYSLNHAG